MTGLERARGRAGELIQALPEAARVITEFAIDNPGQCAVAAAGLVVATRVAVNVIRPRTRLEALATAVILNVAFPWALAELVRRDVISIRIRDQDGGYLVLGKGSSEDRLHPEG